VEQRDPEVRRDGERDRQPRRQAEREDNEQQGDRGPAARQEITLSDVAGHS
jgi:hypothetical protein